MNIDITKIKSSSGREITMRFNYTHDYEVWKKNGCNPRKENISDKTYLIGLKILNKNRPEETPDNKYGNIGIIEEVIKFWHNGYYISILVSYNGSHGLYSYININCKSELIIEDIKESNEKLLMI